MRPPLAYIDGMNTLFTLLFLTCSFFLLCQNPDAFLSTLLNGGAKAGATCVALVATYSLWLGLIKVWEDSGVARGVARLVKPVARKILKTENEEALQNASMNIAVNLLGISGAGTPYGVSTANLLDETDNAEYSSAMFFVLNATSLQILPASIVAMRTGMGSVAPNSILIPTVLTTVFSTLVGVLLVRVFIPSKSKKRSEAPDFSYPSATKTKGVCMQ